MSLIVRNISGAVVEIDDIGIYLNIGEEYDLTEDPAHDIAQSDDLIAEVNAGNLIALDPLDDVTPLTIAQSVEAIQSANDTHYRIRGGELVQLDDVDLTALSDGYQLTYNAGTLKWIAAPPGGTGGGEANTASNLGTGAGWYAQKVGADLQFKSATAGTAIALTPSATEIQIAVDDTQINHINLLNKGVNTHAQIDAHIADATIHFTEGSIDHTNILNIGTNTHAQIDSHIANATIHFTEGSISHLNIQDIGTYTHAQIDSHILNNNIHFTEASISHLNIQDIGINTHAQIDTHIADLTNPHETTVINLHDTDVAGVLDGQAIVYDSSTLTWKPYTFVVSGGGSGRIIQVLFGPISALVSTVSTIVGPTPPLVTDGVEIWSTPITPTATTSNVRVATSFSLDADSNNTEVLVSFFRDSVCIGTALTTVTTKKFSTQFSTTLYDAPLSTSPIIYSCRVAKTSGTVFYINRTADSATDLGGTLENQAYTVEEIGVNP